MQRALSLLLSVAIGLVIAWLLIRLFVGAIKLLGILIALGAAVFAYFALRKLIARSA
jgi:hypothetical protein